MHDQALAPALLRIFAQVLTAAGFGASATEAGPGVTHEGTAGSPDAPKFYSVSEVADMFGISAMAIYRAIHSGRFPAVRVGARRYVVPVKAIHEMAAAASKGLVDAADWVESATAAPAASPSTEHAV